VARKPLHVTVVAHDLGAIGGMERQLGKLVEGLLGAGHRVTVVARTCVVPRHERLRWVHVPGPARPFAIAYPWFFAIGSLLTRLRRGDVLHTTGAIVFNRADVSTVHLCHHAVAEHRDLKRIRRATRAYRLNNLIAQRMSRLAERFVYQPSRTRELVAVSEGVRREIDRYFPDMAGRIEVIPNGVDTEHFRPPERPKAELRSELGLPAEGKIALFVGSEWEGKGLRSAVEALPIAQDWHLTVVGAGDEARYAALAQKLGVAERVHFQGKNPDVLPYYQAAEAFVLPTRYETFSLVTYEAAACGLPLLVGRVSGVEDILQDGINGWFIEQDATQIADRLRLLDEPEAPSMGNAARRASLEFDWDRMVAAYEARYAAAAGQTESDDENNAAADQAA
jgi:glycosyltransferase involved in cell wall biosynthesis